MKKKYRVLTVDELRANENINESKTGFKSKDEDKHGYFSKDAGMASLGGTVFEIDFCEYSAKALVGSDGHLWNVNKWMCEEIKEEPLEIDDCVKFKPITKVEVLVEGKLFLTAYSERSGDDFFDIVDRSYHLERRLAFFDKRGRIIGVFEPHFASSFSYRIYYI